MKQETASTVRQKGQCRVASRSGRVALAHRSGVKLRCDDRRKGGVRVALRQHSTITVRDTDP